jgi:hypothetical protein
MMVYMLDLWVLSILNIGQMVFEYIKNVWIYVSS